MVTIRIEALEVALGSRAVLHGIDAEMAGGGLIGVIGPNGAGKSTLARAMLGLLKPRSGRVLLDSAEVGTLRPADRAKTIAYLPQGQTLHWPLSVERLVALGRMPHLAPFSRLSAADTAAIEAAMAATGTLDLRARDATELSGGERARVMLARALAVEARALIADEPLASLDPSHQMEMMELLAERARAGTLVVVVLHDLTMAARFCDRLMLLCEGRLVADGPPDAVLTDEALEQVYGIAAWRGSAEGTPLLVPLRRS